MLPMNLTLGVYSIPIRLMAYCDFTNNLGVDDQPGLFQNTALIKKALPCFGKASDKVGATGLEPVTLRM